MAFTEKKLRQINRYEGIIVQVTVDRVELSDGHGTFREVVHHPGGVCVLPVDSDGTAWCVRQFRYPFQKELLEAPAGKLEPGEDPAECARRELSEETGFSAGKLIGLGAYYTSPGFSTECLHLYLALDLQPGKAHPDTGELLDVVKLPFSQLHSMVMAGEIPDAKTALAVLKSEKLLAQEQI